MANILYQKLERQYSIDNGNTWITMDAYKVGDIIENPSDCGGESSGSTCTTSTTYSYGDYILTPSSSIVEYNVIPTVMVSRNFTATTTNSDCSTTTETSNEIIKQDVSPTSTNPSGENPNATDRTVTATTEYGTYTFIQQGNPNVDSGGTDNPNTSGGTESSGSTSGGTESTCTTSITYTYGSYVVMPISSIVAYNEISNAKVTRTYTATTTNEDCTITTTNGTEIVESNLIPDSRTPSGDNPNTESRVITASTVYGDYTFTQEGNPNVSSGSTSGGTDNPNTSGGTESSGSTTECTDTLSFAWSGTASTQTFKINRTTYTASTNPFTTTLSELGVDTFTNAYDMFYNKQAVTAITSIPCTNNVTNMQDMFSNCKSLTSLDLSSFDTSNVTNMLGMFGGCDGLTSLDLSNFDTSNVIDMNAMFWGCYNLTSLDLSNFDTSKATNMHSMFDSCYNLTSLDLSSFDTSNVKYMQDMFSNCKSLTSLDLSNFDTSNVTYMNAMFQYCSGLTSLDLSNFDTSKVTDMRFMFDSCSNLTSIKVTNCSESTISKLQEALTSAGFTSTVSNNMIIISNNSSAGGGTSGAE